MCVSDSGVCPNEWFYCCVRHLGTLPCLDRPKVSSLDLDWMHQSILHWVLERGWEAVKDGTGPRPAAQTAKRCFLNCLETSFKPCFYLPSCTANCQLACVVLQLALVLHGSGQWTSSQGLNTMAVMDGAGPRPAAETAKRCFLSCLETSFKPCFYLPSCTANCQLTCVVLQLAFVLHGSGQGTPSQGPNTMAVKDGAGRPAAGTPDCLFFARPCCTAHWQLARARLLDFAPLLWCASPAVDRGRRIV